MLAKSHAGSHLPELIAAPIPRWMRMELMDTIRNRRAVRNYTDLPPCARDRGRVGQIGAAMGGIPPRFIGSDKTRRHYQEWPGGTWCRPFPAPGCAISR